MEEGCGGRGETRVWLLNQEFKRTTTATGMGTSLKKKFNEQDNGCAHALYYFLIKIIIIIIIIIIITLFHSYIYNLLFLTFKYKY